MQLQTCGSRMNATRRMPSGLVARREGPGRSRAQRGLGRRGSRGGRSRFLCRLLCCRLLGRRLLRSGLLRRRLLGSGLLRRRLLRSGLLRRRLLGRRPSSPARLLRRQPSSPRPSSPAAFFAAAFLAGAAFFAGGLLGRSLLRRGLLGRGFFRSCHYDLLDQVAKSTATARYSAAIHRPAVCPGPGLRSPRYDEWGVGPAHRFCCRCITSLENESAAHAVCSSWLAAAFNPRKARHRTGTR